ncbi:MAG: hypothetical protein KatS3mg017_0856 [Fimbriimonadales bacterium]|nr:MAG: hypothetical protein KatS3mg017_0856 [Fimbriimonadales bacterium]
MYVIYISDPENFSATTVNNETNFDTQLWLFDAEGKGVVFNDDEVGSTLSRSRIDNSTGCLNGASRRGFITLRFRATIATRWTVRIA